MKALQAVLGFVHEARSAPSPQPFTQELVDRLTNLVGCEFGRYKEIDLARRIDIAYVPSTSEVQELWRDDDVEEEWDDFFASACNRAVRSTRLWLFSFSGLVSLGRVPARDESEWKADLAEEGCVDRMWMGIVGVPHTGFALDRAGKTFGERDLAMGRALQPHLTDLWHEASTRRRLRAALSALDRDSREGVVLLGAWPIVEFASPTARRFLREYFGAKGSRLPDVIADWGACRPNVPFVARADDRMLIVEAVRDGSALVLSERAAIVEELTPREREIMRCVADGLTNTEIARRLWIAPSTVRKHLEHVFDKVGARSRTAALAKLRPSDLQLVG